MHVGTVNFLVRRPPGDGEVAVGVDRAAVPGEHPPVAAVERVVRRGVVVVAEAAQGAPAGRDPRAAPVGDVLAVLAEQPDVHRGDHPAGGAEPPVAAAPLGRARSQREGVL